MSEEGPKRGFIILLIVLLALLVITFFTCMGMGSGGGGVVSVDWVQEQIDQDPNQPGLQPFPDPPAMPLSKAERLTCKRQGGPHSFKASGCKLAIGEGSYTPRMLRLQLMDPGDEVKYRMQIRPNDSGPGCMRTKKLGKSDPMYIGGKDDDGKRRKTKAQIMVPSAGADFEFSCEKGDCVVCTQTLSGEVCSGD